MDSQVVKTHSTKKGSNTVHSFQFGFSKGAAVALLPLACGKRCVTWAYLYEHGCSMLPFGNVLSEQLGGGHLAFGIAVSWTC